tara:strand:- start:3460 stop:4707 length:1248 start_codon:yes stop_codon:yes gene_type:complete
MQSEPLSLGIDLGTSGVRIALINNKIELVHTESIDYPNGLEEYKDWEYCCNFLISSIPENLKKNIQACSVDGTSGTLIACNPQGKPIGPAIPYFKNYSNIKYTSNKIILDLNRKSFTSLGRALHLIEKYGYKILLRHQADWISSWLTEDWESGEESNNIKLGWNQITKSWPKDFYNQPWIKALPKIISSGNILNRINPAKANILGLPKNLLVIAGTTDSNAAVIAANPSEEEGISILGSTIVLKKFVEKPLYEEGVTNHLVSGKWLCGGSSNAGGAVLKKFFNPEEINELSNQINPKLTSGIKLLPLPFKGERFPINDPNLEPILTPRPISDALYLHALFEGLAEIEHKGWEKLISIGIPIPKRIISIGTGAKNIQWQKIREKILGIPIRRSIMPPAMGVAIIALEAIKRNKEIN